MHTLLFLEPAHFHAALTLRAANSRITPVVHVYARPGPERDAFMAMVCSFGARGDLPTGWCLRSHEPADPERALIEERRGDIVVLAGRNQPKLGTIARLHAAGLHVFADKPWLTDSAALPDLERATAGWPLAADIMTSRHDMAARVAQKVAADQELFGALDRRSSAAAIDMLSVHHLLKTVNGALLRRPSWYYDTRIQGDGLTDIQSHMADQAQWVLGDGPGFAFERDYELEEGRLWSTPVPRSLFRISTGQDDFPEELESHIEAGMLQLACNGEIRYRLRGVSVRQRAEWQPCEPERGGDASRMTARGERATVIQHRGPATGFHSEVHVAPHAPGPDFDVCLSERLTAWEADMPGLSHRPSAFGREIIIPAALQTPHEAQFAMALDDFLDRLDAGTWPAILAARIRARYMLLARAQGRGTACGPYATGSQGPRPIL
ncbi:MAG: hypothetical protein OXF51_02795 [Alphaproteobacteria bacterium]|nr:hypothetical protein [Alphaproteobacteria bacterium]